MDKYKANKPNYVQGHLPVARSAPVLTPTAYKIANNYREFMVDAKLIAELRKRMEGYTGPVVNKGGVR